MKRTYTEAKPLNDLTLRDFDRHPMWGFDLEMGESLEDADKTWVRPWRPTRPDQIDDTVWVRGELSSGATRRRTPCAVSFSAPGGGLALAGLWIWTPRLASFEVMDWENLQSEAVRTYRQELFWTNAVPVSARFTCGRKTEDRRGRLSRDEHRELVRTLAALKHRPPYGFCAEVPVGRSRMVITGEIERLPAATR